MEMLTIRIAASTNKVGSEVKTEFQINKYDWESMSWEERNQTCLDALLESGLIEWDYKIVGKK